MFLLLLALPTVLASTTGQIFLNSKSYSSEQSPQITVTDIDRNIDPSNVDSLNVKLSSTSDASGITIRLTESSSTSGIFSLADAPITLSTSLSDDTQNILRISNGDILTAEYIDPAGISGTQETVRDTSKAYVTCTKQICESQYCQAPNEVIANLTTEMKNFIEYQKNNTDYIEKFYGCSTDYDSCVKKYNEAITAQKKCEAKGTDAQSNLTTQIEDISRRYNECVQAQSSNDVQTLTQDLSTCRTSLSQDQDKPKRYAVIAFIVGVIITAIIMRRPLPRSPIQEQLPPR